MYAEPIDDPWKDDPAGTYWTPPECVSLAEISPVLMAKVLLITDRQRVSIYSATAFDMQSGGPIGQFEVAVDQRKSGRLVCSASAATTHMRRRYLRSLETGMLRSKPSMPLRRLKATSCNAAHRSQEIGKFR
jgi:hypothetical protein